MRVRPRLVTEQGYPGPWANALLVFLVAAAIAVYHPILLPWMTTWGSTTEEAHMRLPGDELVPRPTFQSTRAVTIIAPPERIWPWLVQIGQDRGGFYSYDWLENLFRLGIHSADRIVPEWQERAGGELVHADANGGNGWYVRDVRPPHALVLEMANVKAGRPFRRDEPPFMEFTWAFVLQAHRDGRTRLLVRERVAFGKRLAQVAGSPVGLISFVMTQKMMRGIKSRAETPT